MAQMCGRVMLAAKKIKGKYGVSVVYYNEEISSREEQWVIDAMDAALKNGEFQIYLQPQYSGTGEKFCGAEALVRWIHPVKGKIMPDDFGSGYSSLGILPEMPFDILKLDRQLIKNELKHPGSIQYMIGLAHWLRLQIVAEGIETEEQYACFKQLGCDYMQGFYLEKPMFWEDFERKYVIKMGRQDHENR